MSSPGKHVASQRLSARAGWLAGDKRPERGAADHDAQGTLAPNRSARGPKVPEACLDTFCFPLPQIFLSKLHLF